MVDGLKAYLEHNIILNLIADKFPDKQEHKDHSSDLLWYFLMYSSYSIAKQQDSKLKCQKD